MDLYQKQGMKVVIFNGIVYDIADYANEHPGGAELLENEYGKCIDEPFEEAEHTKSARNIFKDLKVVGKMRETDTASTGSSNDASPTTSKKNGFTGLYGNDLNSKLQFDYTKSLFW